VRIDKTFNDFVLRFGNVNGSGSASANLLCAKALFRMGVMVTPKNIFPSNIQGMPTWYEIRASEEGCQARREGIDVMVAMNPQTYQVDVDAVVTGGTLIYDSTMIRKFSRSDIDILGIPISKLCAENWADPRQRQLFKNVVYLGALARLIDIDNEILELLITEQFHGKPKLIEHNIKALDIGREYSREFFPSRLKVRARKSTGTKGKIMINGNEAAALGALFAEATVAAWYPITPSTSVVEAFERHVRKYRSDKNGVARAAIIQAEDELASVGMAIGANWNGARAFTATSGPGISLMSEFIGLAYFAEIPLVLFNIQRGGPSTGMPTRTQQSDLLICAYASHGDTKHILLFPADPGECFTFGADAFDLADRLQTPVFVMSDLDIGMNDWVVDELIWDDTRKADRGKVLSAAALEDISDFGRYRDIDGDGIAYRTIPGTHPEKGAYFTRGTSHTEMGAYTEDGEIHARNLERLAHKHQTAADILPKPQFSEVSAKSKLGIVNFGSTEPAIREALAMLSSEGYGLNHMRIRSFPFDSSVEDFANRHDYLFVVEQNRDAQMRHLLVAETAIPATKLVSILSYDGMPLTAEFVKNAIIEIFTEQQQVAAACATPITAA